MTIGIDARLWNETGVGRYIRALFYWLPKLDKSNEYVWFLNLPTFESLEMPTGWKKVKCNVHWHTITEQIIMPYFFYRENLDLLHVPYINFPIFYFRPQVVTIHDMIFDHHRSGKFSTLPPWLYIFKKIAYHFVTWNAIHRSETVFTLSQDSKKEMIHHYRADSAKVVVTYESGNLEDPRVKSSRPKKFQPYLLYVGNAHPHKNVETLIKVAQIMRHRLVLVGNDKFFYPRLPKSKFVEVIGEVPNTEIAAWYHYAQALVTASKMEGFGIPPLEAMSVGCPTIVSDIPVFHEIYADAAVYFNPNDPSGIAKTIKETLANKKLIKDLIARGHRQAAKYSWQKCVAETYKTYESCLSL